MGIQCVKIYFYIKRLPQGLALTSYIIKRIMKVNIDFYTDPLRIRLCTYLDDFLITLRKITS